MLIRVHIVGSSVRPQPPVAAACKEGGAVLRAEYSVRQLTFLGLVTAMRVKLLACVNAWKIVVWKGDGRQKTENDRG